MPSPFYLARTTWRKVPLPARRAIESFPLVRRFKNSLSNLIKGTAQHQEIYDEEYYASRSAGHSAQAIADSIADDLTPATVLDVGCGTGDLLSALHAKGITGEGLEYSEAALKVCRDKGLAVQPFDLESDTIENPKRYDLAVSTEVAEHLPEPCADRYVDLLCKASNVVAFTAATPGQGGTDHVNEQPHTYWLDKFAARGYAFDEPTSLKWRAAWEQRGTEPWYFKNLMIVRKG